MASEYAEYSDSELYYLLCSEKAVADKAFAELYRRLSPRVFAYCRRFIGNKDEAQDVFQDVFIRFYQSADKSKDMTNVPAYLLKIARNLCVNAIRSQKNNATFEEYMIGAKEHPHEKIELLGLIKKALKTLSPDYREAFILREYEGLSYQEISEVVDIPMSTVKVRIYRAKQKIKEFLQPYMQEMEKYS